MAFCRGCCGDIDYKFLFTEVVRYIAMLIPICAGIWRYVDFGGYTEFVTSTNCTPSAETGEVSRDCLVQFWGIVAAIIVAVTLLLYTPLKVMFARTALKDARYTYGWRPSILTYIIFCALPSLAFVLFAIKSTSKGQLLNGLDPQSFAVIQATVLGLTITEWMAKMREEDLSFDLLTAVAADFFFAYDVYDFFDIQLREGRLLTSNDWIYVVFVFGLLSLFKYVPHAPADCVLHEKCCRRAVASIVTGMMCQDLPFAIIRIGTLATYGLTVADLVHPLKNLTLIVIDCWQLYVLFRHNQVRKSCSEHTPEQKKSELGGLVPERRVERLWRKLRTETMQSLRSSRADSTVMTDLRHRNVPRNNSDLDSSETNGTDNPVEERRNIFV